MTFATDKLVAISRSLPKRVFPNGPSSQPELLLRIPTWNLYLESLVRIPTQNAFLESLR